MKRTYTNPKELLTENQNTIFANNVSMENSSIIFEGVNNVLFLEDGVRLKGAKIHFHGNSSIVFISKGYWSVYISVDIYSNSVFFMGPQVFFAESDLSSALINVTEGKHVFIGSNCFISYRNK